VRTLLIISTTFFPDPTVPAIRMTQWCRHLPRLGWKPHVLCRYLGHDGQPDQLAERVHPEVVVEYLDRWEPGSGREGARSGRGRRMAQTLLDSRLGLGGLFVPDPSIRFWRGQRQKILERVRAIQPDAILTTSPPHSIHDVGLWLAEQTGIPWVADFRDPYIIDNRFKPKGLGLLRYPAHRRFKESIYRRAWLITHAIPNQARHARRFMPYARDRIRILTNAFPPEMLTTEKRGEPSGRKTVLVTGTIPEPEQVQLAQAVAALAREGLDLELKLLGRRPDCEPKLRELLGPRLVLPGYVPHVESVGEVARADVLVNFLDAFRSESRLLSTKLFEYLASGRPVLCVNPSRVDRLLLWRATGVTILRRPTPEQLRAALGRLLAGQVQRDPQEVERFRAENTWASRAGQIAAALDGLVAFPPRQAPAARHDGPPVASVVITTRNRQDCIRLPILSALHQTVPVEVIVVDDGSTDGTGDLVSREYPQVRVVRHENSRGYIVRRNEAARLASTPVVVSLDDDAYFSSARVVEQVLRELDDPRVGAVAIPCIDVRRSQDLRQAHPGGRDRWVTDSFIGTAHAVRRDVFLRLGGYREPLFHQGEEMDLCIRMLDAGLFVRLGQSAPIHHLESVRRDYRRMDFYGARNAVLFVWQNVPWPAAVPHGLATVGNILMLTWQPARLLVRLRGIAEAVRCCWRGDCPRKPVTQAAYRLFRKLRRSRALPLPKTRNP